MEPAEEALLDPSQIADHTVLHPLALASIILLGIAMLALPRRFAMLPLVLMACFIAPAQRIVIAGLDFNLLRVMVLFGWARIFIRSEYREFRWRGLDTAVALWAMSATITYTILMGSASAFVNRLGASFDMAGMYFLLRCLIRSWYDFDQAVWCVIIVSVPVAVAFLIEHHTGRNAFAIFGGVPFVTLEREGRLRCQGAFPHPIMAGCFFASFMPVIAARWWGGRSLQPAVIVGLVASGIIVLCSASSTPIMAVFFGLVGAFAFTARRKMRAVRWGIVTSLLLLHLCMKAPVWHLVSRINVVGGSTGWHRFHLINSAIEEFGSWWLLGTTSTEDWGAGLRDVTNQYVLEGVRGGLLTLVIFVAILILSFAETGRLWRAWSNQPIRLWSSWALGVGLFVHCMNFFAVSYFGQTVMAFVFTLACAASLGSLPQMRPVVSIPRVQHLPSPRLSRAVPRA